MTTTDADRNGGALLFWLYHLNVHHQCSLGSNDHCDLFHALKRVGEERKNHIIAAYTMPSVDLNETDVVFVGFPLWYSEAPEFLMDCLKRYDFTRKKIIPLSTSGASHIKNSLKSLQSSVGDSSFDA